MLGAQVATMLIDVTITYHELSLPLSFFKALFICQINDVSSYINLATYVSESTVKINQVETTSVKHY